MDIEKLEKHLSETPLETLREEWAKITKDFPSPTKPTKLYSLDEVVYLLQNISRYNVELHEGVDKTSLIEFKQSNGKYCKNQDIEEIINLIITE